MDLGHRGRGHNESQHLFSKLYQSYQHLASASKQPPERSFRSLTLPHHPSWPTARCSPPPLPLLLPPYRPFLKFEVFETCRLASAGAGEGREEIR